MGEQVLVDRKRKEVIELESLCALWEQGNTADGNVWCYGTFASIYKYSPLRPLLSINVLSLTRVHFYWLQWLPIVSLLDEITLSIDFSASRRRYAICPQRSSSEVFRGPAGWSFFKADATTIKSAGCGQAS